MPRAGQYSRTPPREALSKDSIKMHCSPKLLACEIVFLHI